jgi:hypothetical protein
MSSPPVCKADSDIPPIVQHTYFSIPSIPLYLLTTLSRASNSDCTIDSSIDYTILADPADSDGHIYTVSGSLSKYKQEDINDIRNALTNSCKGG